MTSQIIQGKQKVINVKFFNKYFAEEFLFYLDNWLDHIGKSVPFAYSAIKIFDGYITMIYNFANEAEYNTGRLCNVALEDVCETLTLLKNLEPITYSPTSTGEIVDYEAMQPFILSMDKMIAYLIGRSPDDCLYKYNVLPDEGIGYMDYDD